MKIALFVSAALLLGLGFHFLGQPPAPAEAVAEKAPAPPAGPPPLDRRQPTAHKTATFAMG